MKCFLYLLRCKDGLYYTGITWNLKKRISEHNAGVRSPLQKSKLPVTLVCWEIYNTREEAARREKEIKGWRREKKEALIKSLH